MTEQPPPHPALVLPLEVINRLNLSYMDHIFSLGRDRMRGTLELAMMGLRTLLLLNGGAIIALFTVLGPDKHIAVAAGPVRIAFTSFAIGAVLSLTSVLFGFLSQSAFAQYELKVGIKIYQNASGRPWKQEIREPGIGQASWYLAIGLAIASLAAFLAGAFQALQGVKFTG